MADATDFLDLFDQDPGTARATAAQLAAAMRQRRDLGTLTGLFGAMSGDKGMAGFGQEQSGEADRMQQALMGAAQHRAQQAIEQKRWDANAQHQRALEALMMGRLGVAQDAIDLKRRELTTKTDPLGNIVQAPRYSGVLPGATGNAKPAPAPKPAPAGPTPMSGVDAIVQSIIDGKRPPVLKGLGRAQAAVAAGLAQRGFDAATAESDWNATQKHIAIMNNGQQTRLRQTLDSMPHQIDNIETLYRQWQKVGPNSGFKLFNKAALSAAKQMGGEVGAIAANLEAQIHDVSAELANVYMGGNSPTDHALELASTNLSGDWDEATFNKALELLRRNVQIRRNSVLQSPVGGASPNNRYAPPTTAPIPEPTQKDTPRRRKWNPTTGKLED